jgi:hypothetical protein
MNGMYGGDMARQHMNDRMREAQAYRLTKETRAAQSAERRATVRRVVSTALGMLLWPVKH